VGRPGGRVAGRHAGDPTKGRWWSLVPQASDRSQLVALIAKHARLCQPMQPEGSQVMNLKVSKAICAGLVLLALLASPCLAAFTEGVDYLVLKQPIPHAENTLIKVFSYDCPFCYKYDKNVFPIVVLNLPAGMTFRPFHLKTRGKYGVLGSELFAVLLVKDQEHGLSDKDLYSQKSLLKKAMTAYYEAYHDRKERWDAGPDAYLKTGLDAVGMSRAEFDAARNAPKVKALLAEWDVSYDIGKFQGVPAFVVNGKYLIFNKSIKSVGSMLELINELAKK
jgi:thiol:disulfide interchange protein DsbA